MTAGSPIQISNDHDDRVVAKIDANISDTQRLSLTGIYTKDSITSINRNFNNSVSTASDDYLKPNRSVRRSCSAELGLVVDLLHRSAGSLQGL